MGMNRLRWGGKSAMEQTSQEANKPGGKEAMHRGESAKGERTRRQKIQGQKSHGRISQGVKRQRGEKAIIPRFSCNSTERKSVRVSQKAGGKTSRENMSRGMSYAPLL